MGRLGTERESGLEEVKSVGAIRFRGPISAGASDAQGQCLFHELAQGSLGHSSKRQQLS